MPSKETVYTCKNCGSTKVYAKPKGRRMGIYCGVCGEWICFTTYSKMLELYKRIEDDPDSLSDRISLRYIKKYNGVTTMRCKKCDTLLYSSVFPKVKGQFDLVNASFCPNCGRELM